ncbi:MAG: 1-deoxy-D-xylulose-5-phosphate reductoisomerase [Eubacteriales bacterium]|nr:MULTISPECIES: 1-deoxy-D-xylulose-5-phosphate reductoisomerase [unclassified Butyricicoccus]RHO16719.1 1-deoxy-D-xylulose-5-phosphate reductoisomerase [Butyricicoccus sp. AM18-35]RHV73739.1 1-deoxy-D-xylulose-5-phosphate reductoisomerase [Butyricicoccus sp. OF13-6]
MKKIAILGSTGSIGTQTVDILPSIDAEVVALTTNRRINLLEEQARALHPKMVCAMDENAAKELKIKLADTDIEVLTGMDGLIACAAESGADIVVTAVVGMVGLLPTMAAIKAGKDIALANKETLVCAGGLVMSAAKQYGVRILPVDSEHSAIFQCVQAANGNPIDKILLTASGGPFFGKKIEEMRGMTREQALAHPNWSMGAKITIDSATMMNKGLELIEAMWLYNLPPEDIEIVVHRESIVHSAVEFADGAVIAQLGLPDMRLPIQLALTWPQRVPCKVPRMSLAEVAKLTFYAPDYEAFPALNLAKYAASLKGDRGAVLNGANEAAVGLFLNDKIGFTDIAERVAYALDTIPYKKDITLDDVLAADKAAREIVLG